MFKRSMLVAAMLGLSAGANAVSLITPATKVNITPQAIGADGVLVKAPDFKITVVDDLDLNGKSMQIAFSKPLIPALMPATLAKANCDDAAAIASVTYAGLTNDNKTANYSIVGDNTKNPKACEITVTGMHFAKGDLTIAGITAVSSFTLIGAGVSPSLSKTVLDLTKDQFKVTVGTPANAKIDVNNARKKYIVNGAAATADTIAFTVGDLAAASTLGATVTGQEFTVTGDFSWADDPSTAAFDPTTKGNRATVPVAIDNGAAFVAAKSSTTSLVFADTGVNNGTYTITLTPIVDANLADADTTNDVLAVAIPVQTFTVANKVSFTDESINAAGTGANVAGTQTIAAVAAGAHSLNGASTKIFAVPFGPEIESHNIFVSNSGTSTGAITGTLNYAGNDAVSVDLGTAAPGVNYVNVMAALEAASAKPAFGRGDLTLTVNAPEADITFTAGYTTATGRSNLFMQEQANISTVTNSALTQATTAATQSTAAATDAAAAKTDSAAAKAQAVCTYAALGEGVDADASGTTVKKDDLKFTKTGGC